MRYLDTSVLVSALTHESRTREMQIWLGTQPIDQLTISDWVVTEFSGALSLKLTTGQLTPEQRASVLAMFTQLRQESLQRFSITSNDFHAAAQMADHYQSGLRSGDALHLAIAANHGAQFCTLDRQLSKAAEVMGVSVLLL